MQMYLLKSVFTGVAFLILTGGALASEVSSSGGTSGGTIHFQGAVVNPAHFDVKSRSAVDTNGRAQWSVVEVRHEGRKVGEMVVVEWE